MHEKELMKELERAVGQRMGRTGKALMQQLDEELQKAGVSYSASQVIVLANVFRCEGLNQQTVAQMMHRDKACATRLIDSLEEASLVVRVPNKSDRRQNLLYLTNEGRGMVHKFAVAARKTQEIALKGINDDELEIFNQVLDRIRNNLES